MSKCMVWGREKNFRKCMKPEGHDGRHQYHTRGTTIRYTPRVGEYGYKEVEN